MPARALLLLETLRGASNAAASASLGASVSGVLLIASSLSEHVDAILGLLSLLFGLATALAAYWFNDWKTKLEARLGALEQRANSAETRAARLDQLAVDLEDQAHESRRFRVWVYRRLAALTPQLGPPPPAVPLDDEDEENTGG